MGLVQVSGAVGGIGPSFYVSGVGLVRFTAGVSMIGQNSFGMGLHWSNIVR